LIISRWLNYRFLDSLYFIFLLRICSQFKLKIQSLFPGGDSSFRFATTDNIQIFFREDIPLSAESGLGSAQKSVPYVKREIPHFASLRLGLHFKEHHICKAGDSSFRFAPFGMTVSFWGGGEEAAICTYCSSYAEDLLQIAASSLIVLPFICHSESRVVGTRNLLLSPQFRS